MSTVRRLGVVDLGSNSFRLVVFTRNEQGWWKRTDEVHETVRIGEGLAATGELGAEPMERALRVVELFAHFVDAVGLEEVRAVATSAIRDASNGPKWLKRARRHLPIEVLAREDEARYGWLAAVNSTTLTDGAVLDIGGGSMQLVQVRDRRALELDSWPLGAVRMTERFLPGDEVSKKALRKLRAHVAEELSSAAWLTGGLGGELIGIGGSLRNLAAAAQRGAGVEFPHVQGVRLRGDELDELVAELARRPVAERGDLPGIKPGRGDVILAAAVVIRAAMEVGGFDCIEATEAGLREGIFFSELLAGVDPPLFDDVRRASVRNLAAQYHADLRHPEHVTRLALALWDGLAAAGAHKGDPWERELLGAAAMLHDIGMTVDYDDHHKHSKYLILNAGLPGWSPRELALLALMTRYHRKGNPGVDELGAVVTGKSDVARLNRCASVLRVVEHLERARDGLVSDIDVRAVNGSVRLELRSGRDVAVARWGAERQGELFERAFGRALVVA